MIGDGSTFLEAGLGGARRGGNAPRDAPYTASTDCPPYRAIPPDTDG